MDTFKTLSGAAKAAGAQTWLPELVEANILKPSDVMARIEPDPALQMPAATWDALRHQLQERQTAGWRVVEQTGGRERNPEGPTTPATRYSLARVIASRT